MLDPTAVARSRRDAFMTKAKFWHDVSVGRDPVAFRRKRDTQRQMGEARQQDRKMARQGGGDDGKTQALRAGVRNALALSELHR